MLCENCKQLVSKFWLQQHPFSHCHCKKKRLDRAHLRDIDKEVIKEGIYYLQLFSDVMDYEERKEEIERVLRNLRLMLKGT